MSRFVRIFCLLLTSVFGPTSFFAQNSGPTSPVPDSFYSALQWRCIGPHRGGRVLAVSGVRGEPETFYFGAVGGGVWKTTDAGRTWFPIFDSQPVQSIGALAVSWSDPSVIYVGTGEADMRSDISFGNGMYKSTDAGQTWMHLGLTDTRQIGRILVDPKNPDIVLVAALGHGFGPNSERGVFRSSDGGRTWTKVLYKNEDIGAIDLAFDPDNSRTVFATLWNARRPFWNAYAPITGSGGGIYKSTDGGLTWREIAGRGLPSGKLGRIGVDVVAGQAGQRVYALIDADRSSGLYRSDDGGDSWNLVNTDSRLLSRGWYFGEVRSDPKNPDLVYVSNVAFYRSFDGGKTFKTIRGAPGGDDYHSLWIDPENPSRMISGVDQGTLVTVNGGKTWSSWYNQPTAQFYHVTVDNQFPYWVYGAQQDSGTAAVISRSDYGQITFRDWHPVGAGESGYIAPDPVNPDIVFGGSTGGELFRYNRKTGQVQDVSPTPAEIGMKTKHRYQWTTPLVFSPQPPHALYQSSQFLMKTVDAGKSWKVISPDLTLLPGEKEEDARGVIYSIAPSPVAAGTIWIGTDNGLIQLTRDEGRTWNNITPRELAPWSMVSLIDASPHDAATAYAAIDRHQLDDIKPYIYRTRDFGKTWTKITKGLPDNSYVHAVREDPVRKGLLFAGTEHGVHVSFNDGEMWQPLQLNLPHASIRDLLIKGNDLVVATHGRSFWILDDISPLRELTSPVLEAPVHLFRPATAIRIRKNQSRDTPLPPETPAGENPPTGAIIDFSLNAIPAREVTLEILDSAGKLVRKFSSNDEAQKVEDTQAFPTYWLRPPAPLSRKVGLNRFVWDLRHSPPPALRFGYSIAVAYGENATMVPEGPLAIPGLYRVKLTVDGRSLTVPLEVKLDPRVKISPLALSQQLALEMKIIDAMNETYVTTRQVNDLRRQLKELQAKTFGEILRAVTAVDNKAAELVAVERQWPPVGVVSVASLNGALGSLLQLLQSSDATPTSQALGAFTTYQQLLDQQRASWSVVKVGHLEPLNKLLQKRGMAAITIKQ